VGIGIKVYVKGPLTFNVVFGALMKDSKMPHFLQLHGCPKPRGVDSSYHVQTKEGVLFEALAYKVYIRERYYFL
jgi:hypothetical protein